MKSLFHSAVCVAVAISFQFPAKSSEIAPVWEGTYEGDENSFVSLKKVIFSKDKNGNPIVRAWLVGFPEAVPLGEAPLESYLNARSLGQKNTDVMANHYFANFSNEKVKAILTITPGYWNSGKLEYFACNAFVKNLDGTKVFIEHSQLKLHEPQNSSASANYQNEPDSNANKPATPPHSSLAQPATETGGQASFRGWAQGPVSITVSGADSTKNLPDLDFGPYMADLQRRVKRAWFPPRGQESKRVIVAFELRSSGLAGKQKIEKSSGNALADQSALQAVSNANPFRQLPAGAPDLVKVHFTFDYNVFSGGRSF